MTNQTKEPWGEGTPWKSSTAFFTYLRGCLRKAWVRHPAKLTLLNKKRYQIPNPNPRGNKPTIWGADCVKCKGTFPIKDIQIDHATPAGSLQCIEDIQGFAERLLCVRAEDLRTVCKECNSALALSDKQKISYEEAINIKRVISLEKEKTVVSFITAAGLVPASNAKARRQQALDILNAVSAKEV